eukprot:TRINITY_DN27406_c0_g1_i1.p1 TRINITY_DN27406_c0_g1~~TRINITY_DN27406_c0_g1_i1.p1  ORF type:complete len:821 (-),score=139.66 TRINITY_DN27406_c0_g1_i1:36-2498(-)
MTRSREHEDLGDEKLSVWMSVCQPERTVESSSGGHQRFGIRGPGRGSVGLDPSISMPRTSRCHPGCLSPGPRVEPAAVSPLSGFSKILAGSRKANSRAGSSSGAWTSRVSTRAGETPSEAPMYSEFSKFLPSQEKRPATSLGMQEGRGDRGPFRHAPTPDPVTDRSGATSAPPVIAPRLPAANQAWGEDRLFGESVQDTLVGGFSMFSGSVMRSMRSQVNADMASMLQLLGGPHSLWQPQLWTEIRSEAGKHPSPEEQTFLQKLHMCAKKGTDRALLQKLYQVADETIPGKVQSYDMGDVLCPSTKVRWYGRQNTAVKGTEDSIGKAVPPPLLVCDHAALDVAAKLRAQGITRPIMVVTELRDFDQAGAPQFSHQMSQLPHCVPLRTDFSRFCEEAKFQMVRSKATIKEHMRAQQDAYAFFSQEVSVFRGSQNDGYPFLTDPFRIHMIACSLWTNRPLIKTVSSNGARQVLYSKKEDANLLIERLNLIAHIAIRETSGELQASPEDKPILILPVIGLGGGSFHPQHSLAAVLKAWRRRFTRFFHSVYICCMDRGRSDYELSDLIDEQVNKTVYHIAENQTLADKAMPWHWDKRELQLSVQGPKLEIIGNFLKGGEEADVESWRVSKRERERSQYKDLDPKKQVRRGQMRAYKERQDQRAVDDAIKNARREGNWLVENTDAKLGGLKNANFFSGLSRKGAKQSRSPKDDLQANSELQNSIRLADEDVKELHREIARRAELAEVQCEEDDDMLYGDDTALDDDDQPAATLGDADVETLLAHNKKRQVTDVHANPGDKERLAVRMLQGGLGSMKADRTGTSRK